MFLLIHDVVLRARNDTSVLNALDGLSDGNASENWVGTEALPVTASCWYASQRPSYRTELDIYALASMLHAHCVTARLEEAGRPSSSYIDPGREGGVVIGCRPLTMGIS